MIRFKNVFKSYKAGATRKYILRNATFELPWRNIAILGVNGAGKSTMVRMLAGAELPDKGEIQRDVSISWPLGFSGAFHGSLSGIENLRFVCRIYNKRMDDVIGFVEDFAGLGPYLEMPVKTYSSGMRARLAFALSMAVDFECYLIDEITAVGDATFQQRCVREFERKQESSRIILVSHSESTVRKYCDMGGVLYNSELTLYDEIDDAIKSYQEILRSIAAAKV
ncbi:MAG: ABC transporter ATP-binding protein [Proteobacteria bacterium]|nr:ABC transporter ATP-binding protein [Pseudomonadota bacterium]